MYGDYRVVAVTPAGRQKYLEILHHYVSRDIGAGLIDEWHLWLNTTDSDDIAYCKSLTANNRIKVVPCKVRPNQNKTIHTFFCDYVAADTIYIRFDDDVCYVAPDAAERLLEFRVENPEFFIVLPAIINNALVAHIHYRFGLYPARRRPQFDYFVLGNLWRIPTMAAEVHERFLVDVGDNIDRYKFDKWLLHGDRMSINCICWFGKEFAKFGGKVGIDEENWLTQGRHNCVCGTAIVSHFAFYTQRPYLETTDLLGRYKDLCQTLP